MWLEEQVVTVEGDLGPEVMEELGIVRQVKQELLKPMKLVQKLDSAQKQMMWKELCTSGIETCPLT